MDEYLKKCAERMTRTLARKPRSSETRAYVASLPKRREIKVRIEEFKTATGLSGQKLKLKKNKATAGKVIANTDRVRRDRLRPSVSAKRAAHSMWSCRPLGYRSAGLPAIGSRPMRTKMDCVIQRFILFAAQDGYCALCGKPLLSERSLDHCIPFASGGTDRLGNLVLSHGECNARKSDDAPTGCEMVWLLVVNSVIGVKPDRF